MCKFNYTYLEAFIVYKFITGAIISHITTYTLGSLLYLVWATALCCL